MTARRTPVDIDVADLRRQLVAALTPSAEPTLTVEQTIHLLEQHETLLIALDDRLAHITLCGPLNLEQAANLRFGREVARGIRELFGRELVRLRSSCTASKE